MVKTILVSLFCLSFFNWCAHTTEKVLKPVNLAIIYDMSGSSTQNKVAELNKKTIDLLTNMVFNTGGSINYLALTENSFVPIERLDLEKPAGMSLKQKAILYKKQTKGINLFKRKVTASILSGRNAVRTDLYGAIKRASRLFNEPIIGVPKTQILLLITDGIDNARKHAPNALPNDVNVLLVGNTLDRVVKEIGGNVQVFEGLDAAIKHITQLSQGRK